MFWSVANEIDCNFASMPLEEVPSTLKANFRLWAIRPQKYSISLSFSMIFTSLVGCSESLRMENLESSWSLGVKSSKRDSCLLTVFCISEDLFTSPTLPCLSLCPKNFFAKVLNSNSSKMVSSFGILKSFIFISSKDVLIGTSWRIVARYFDRRISSAAVSTFSRILPLIWSVLSSIFSILPNCWISFMAVFSPTPGHP